MTQYKRQWACGVCGGEVIYDSKKRTIKCKCAESPHYIPDHMLREAFERVKP